MLSATDFVPVQLSVEDTRYVAVISNVGVCVFAKAWLAIPVKLTVGSIPEVGAAPVITPVGALINQKYEASMLPAEKVTGVVVKRVPEQVVILGAVVGLITFEDKNSIVG